MKNFVQPGNNLDLIAPTGGVVSGLPVIIGQIFAVPVASKAQTEVFAGVVEGVVEVAKLSTDNMTVGLKVNWDDTAKEVKLAAGDLDGVGTVVEAAAASSTLVKIKLTPL